MFAADAAFEVLAGFAAARDADAHKLAHAIALDRHEWIRGEDALALVNLDKPAGIVAAEAKAGLGQVVGAKAEELRRLGDLAGAKSRTRQLDHGADQVFELRSFLHFDRFGDLIDRVLEDIELALGG